MANPNAHNGVIPSRSPMCAPSKVTPTAKKGNPKHRMAVYNLPSLKASPDTPNIRIAGAYMNCIASANAMPNPNAANTLACTISLVSSVTTNS